MSRLRPVLIIVLFCGVLLGDRTARGQQAPILNREYELKAGYFAYFGQLITWPNPAFAGGQKEFVIGILGKNPFGQYLRAGDVGFEIAAGRVKAKGIQKKKINVVEYKSVDDFNKNYNPCHILFIGRSATANVRGETAQQRVDAAIKRLKGQPVLLVTEATGKQASQEFARAGAMISYWNDVNARQVKMFINRTAATREGLTISAKLLGLRLVEVL